MSRVQSIKLTHLNGPLPQYVLVHHIPGGDEWKIVNIEIYADPAYTVLLADDIQVDTLPLSSQMALFGHLNEWQHSQREHGLRRLAVDLASDAALARAWH